MFLGVVSPASNPKPTAQGATQIRIPTNWVLRYSTQTSLHLDDVVVALLGCQDIPLHKALSPFLPNSICRNCLHR